MRDAQDKSSGPQGCDCTRHRRGHGCSVWHSPPQGVRTLRFRTYRVATNSPKRWFRWVWNEYREILTAEGIGVRIGGGLQVGRRMFSVRWRRFPRLTGCAPDCDFAHTHKPRAWK